MAVSAIATRTYLSQLERSLQLGVATEHTYRPDLRDYLEALAPGVIASNEPKRAAYGAPDFVVASRTPHGPLTIGYLEAKDIGIPLDTVEDSEQLRRYRRSLPNLILTDYLEFRWYVDGERRAIARLATPDAHGRLRADPDGPARVEELLITFLGQSLQPIRDPRALAERMARLTHMIRDIAVAALAPTPSPSPAAAGEGSDALPTAARFSPRDAAGVAQLPSPAAAGEGLGVGEPRYGVLDGLFEDFKQVLLPDLTPETFADMFAQTLAYGLFAARQRHTGAAPFRRQDAAYEIPKTNPFLRKLFGSIVGPDLDDEPFVGFVDDLAQLLAQTDMDAVLADFGRRTRREDPIVHFYETFLTAYDPKLRELRGVYYTPEPVVSYIVRSVDALLRSRLGCAEGLADTATITYEYEDVHGVHTAQAPRVLLLDPACGTGTFLYAVVDHIREQFQRRNAAGLWPAYVSQHLLPRLFGFELLMAPYAMAHLKLGLQLGAADLPAADRDRWAYQFDKDERLGVFLTNTLDEALKRASALTQDRYISDEADEAAAIKQNFPVMVALGNPPYSGHSANKGKWIEDLLHGRVKGSPGDYFAVDGQPLGERNPKWLNDDYVKFIRFAQWRIERTGQGALAFITNHSYLDNPTFRGMRQSLLTTFDELYLLDLHGNSKKKERAPDGGKDENVFDIQQGVAIALFVKLPALTLARPVGFAFPSPTGGGDGMVGDGMVGGGAVGAAPPMANTPDTTTPSAAVPLPVREGNAQAAGQAREGAVHHADLWGTRADKYAWLADHDMTDTPWQTLTPQAPFYLFAPQDQTYAEEYARGWLVTDIMPTHSLGIVTARDELTIDFTREKVWNRVNDFAHIPPEDARQKYKLGPDARDWQVKLAQQDLLASGPSQFSLAPILYRPFDMRETYYTGKTRGFHCMPRPEVMRHMMTGTNLAFLTNRQVNSGFRHAFCTRSIADNCAVSLESKERTNLFPLYLYPDPSANAKHHGLWDGDVAGQPAPANTPGGRRANLAPAFVAALTQRLGLMFVADGVGGLAATVGPENIFHYMYAVCHAPGYRSRYADYLKLDFPRIPLTGDRDLFRALCGLGARLVALHLLEADAPPILTYPERGNDVVERAVYTPPTAEGEPGRIWINKTQYFEGAPPDVWEFTVGGYQVAHKWLKDRKGRRLSYHDLTHYQRTVAALAETARLMENIDEVVIEHGGWPLG